MAEVRESRVETDGTCLHRCYSTLGSVRRSAIASDDPELMRFVAVRFLREAQTLLEEAEDRDLYFVAKDDPEQLSPQRITESKK